MSEKTDRIKKLFENFDQITPEKMQGLINESIKAFEELIAKMNSKDEEEKKQAMKDAAELRDVLQQQAKKALEKTNLSKEEIDKFINNPENFKPEEWRAIQEAKKELESYQTELEDKGVIKKGSMKEHTKEESKDKKHKHHKQHKNWMQG